MNLIVSSLLSTFVIALTILEVQKINSFDPLIRVMTAKEVRYAPKTKDPCEWCAVNYVILEAQMEGNREIDFHLNQEQRETLLPILLHAGYSIKTVENSEEPHILEVSW